jgi:hypothetical protein
VGQQEAPAETNRRSRAAVSAVPRVRPQQRLGQRPPAQLPLRTARSKSQRNQFAEPRTTSNRPVPVKQADVVNRQLRRSGGPEVLGHGLDALVRLAKEGLLRASRRSRSSTSIQRGRSARSFASSVRESRRVRERSSRSRDAWRGRCRVRMVAPAAGSGAQQCSSARRFLSCRVKAEYGCSAPTSRRAEAVLNDRLIRGCLPSGDWG